MKPGYFTVSTNESVNVTWRGKAFNQRGTADATNMYGYWYLNRVLVQPPESRGKGVGLKLIKKLIEELRKVAKGQVLIVTPGGYGEDSKSQFAFYRKAGFVATEPGTMEFRL